jgi:predicted N-acetyltransferase YhbS
VSDPYAIVETLTERQIEELHALIQQQWWGGRRSLDDVKLMAANTSLMLGLVEVSSGRIVGFCRVLTDFAFLATIYDVIVTEELKGRGLGKRLMDTLCNHPSLQRVSFIYLACEPELSAFYERWGFKTYEGRGEWMIKVQREE